MLDKKGMMRYNQEEEVIFLKKIFIDENTHISSIDSVVFYTKGLSRSSDYSNIGKGRCELIYKKSGITKVTYNRKSETEYSGSVRFLPCKKDEFFEYKVERIESGECIDIYFYAESALADEMVILDMSKNEKLEKLFDKIYGIWSSKAEGYYERSMAVFYEIISLLKIGSSERYMPKSQYLLLEPALKYIGENWSNPDFDFSMPPRLSGISYSYYKQLFIKRFGITPSKYLQNLRIKNAAELLDSCLYSVSEVAEMTGFANVYYFSRRFKEQVGISPGSYSARQKSKAK